MLTPLKDCANRTVPLLGAQFRTDEARALRPLVRLVLVVASWFVGLLEGFLGFKDLLVAEVKGFDGGDVA